MRVPARPSAPRPALAAALLCALCVAPAATAGPPRQDFGFAADLYQKGRYDIAAEKFADFLADHPTDPLVKRAALLRGFSLYAARDLRGGVRALRDGLALPGETTLAADALLRIGLGEEALGNPTAAVAALDRLREEHPASEVADGALWPLGRARRAAGDLAGAERAFKQFLNARGVDATSPLPADLPAARAAESVEVRQALGAVLRDRGELDDAAAVFRAAAAGTGSAADRALSDLGLIEYGRDNFREAASLFTKLVDRAAATNLKADGLVNRGFSRYRLGEFAAAADDLRAAAAIAPPDRVQLARLWAGRAAEKAGDPAAAAADFAAAEAAAPDGDLVPDVLYQWGVTLAGGEAPADRAAALEKFRRVLAEHADSPVADDARGEAAHLLYRQAEMALRSGERAEARTLAAEATALDPAAAEAPGMRFLLTRLDEAALTPEAPAADRAAIERRYADLAADVAAPAFLRRDAALRRAESLRRRGEFADALAAFRAVTDGLRPGEDDTALRDGLRLGVAAAVAAGDADAAAELGARFLGTFPDAPRAAEVRAFLADAAAATGSLAEARASYDAATEAGRTARTDRLALKLAARAVDELEALPAAADRRERIEELAGLADSVLGPVAAEPSAGLSDDDRAEALAIRGYALLHLGRYMDAAAAFDEAARKYPDAPVHSEALVYGGVALSQAGRPEAEASLRKSFRLLAPAEPAPPGAESPTADRVAYAAGLELARLLARDPDRAAAAGEAYAELLAKFPAAAQAADVLWEWGTTLFDAGLHDDADAVFARLVDRHPTHPRADDALEYLAESDFYADPPRYAQAVDRLARLIAPAPGEPIEADEATVKQGAGFYLSALNALDRPREVIAAGDALAERFPGTPLAGEAKVQAAEARVRLTLDDANAADAPALLAAARDDLRAVRQGIDPDALADTPGGRPDWVSRPWILGADLAFRAKDYAEVDALATRLDAWRPPPPDLYEMREIHARRFKQQAVPDIAAAEKLAQSVMDDPAARGTAAADNARILLADLALLRTPKDLERAREVYLSLEFSGSTAASKALGAVRAGEMDEALGDSERAARQYRAVIANYADSPSAAVAADRLKALGG